MPKAIKMEDMISLDDLPDVDEMMFGRRYIREQYTRDQVYDIVQFKFWRDYLCSLAMSAFKWDNVPAGIDPRAIEYILLYFGQGAMFMDEGGLLFAQAAPSNNINMFYNPNAIMLTAPNGQTWQRHCETWVLEGEDGERIVMPKDACMCFDNMLRLPMMRYINNYAKRLAMFDRIIDLNIGAQRTPYIITGAEEAKKTRQAVIRKLDNNDQYISLNASVPGGVIGIDVLNTNAPYVADKIMSDKQKVLNEAVTFVGVDNTNNEKKERMIDAEATSNNEQIMVMRRSRLQSRRYFCELCNRQFDMPNGEMNVKWGVPHMKEQAGMDVTDENDGIFYESEETELTGGE